MTGDLNRGGSAEACFPARVIVPAEERDERAWDVPRNFVNRTSFAIVFMSVSFAKVFDFLACLSLGLTGFAVNSASSFNDP
jgi:hypothetical protein